MTVTGYDCFIIFFQDLENYILELIPTLPQVFFLSLYKCTWAIIYIMLWKSVVVHHLVILYHNRAPQCTTSYHGMVCAKFTMLNISKKT